MVPAQRIERLNERDEVTRNQSCPLVYQLIERVLSIRTRFTPIDRPGRIVYFGPIERNMLAVTLHRQLLQIGRKTFEVLLVRQNRDCLCTEEISVPHRQKAQENRQVALERRGAEVLIHLVKAVEHRLEIFRAEGEYRREANRRVHGITSSNPVPKLEHVGCIDAELGYL